MSEKAKLKAVLQDTCPVLCKSVKFIQDKEKPRNYHKLEETWQLSTMIRILNWILEQD